LSKRIELEKVPDHFYDGIRHSASTDLARQAVAEKLFGPTMILRAGVLLRAGAGRAMGAGPHQQGDCAAVQRSFTARSKWLAS